MKTHSPNIHRRAAQCLAVLFLAISIGKVDAQTTREQFKALTWDRSHAGEPLDLGQGKETFRDDFNTMDVTADGGKGPWFAPIHADWGAAHFLAGPNGPYMVNDGKLTIRAEKVGDKWTAGSVQTVDKKGQGFAQQYGYFEFSGQMPAGTGTWMGFWLLSQNGFTDPTKNRTEMDIIEWYGGDPKGMHTTVHLWPAARPDATTTVLTKHTGVGKYYNLTPFLTDGKLQGFHTYGIKVTPVWVIAYFDRKEVERFPTIPEFKTPLYMLASITMQPKQMEKANSPQDLVVDYAVAYSLDPKEAAETTPPLPTSAPAAPSTASEPAATPATTPAANTDPADTTK